MPTPEKTKKQRGSTTILPVPDEPDAEVKEAFEGITDDINKGIDDNSDESAEELVNEADEAMEILEPKVEARRWVVGKPPEEGGKDTEYSIYVQQPLGYMARNRLYALIGRTMAQAIKVSGGNIGGMEDIFGGGGGTIRERAVRLSNQDFADASQFFTLAMELVGYNADFLGEFYAIALEVPYGDRVWFKNVIEQPYRPSEDKWGLEEDAGVEMIEIFIDQNYEEIRRFFAVKLPLIAKRARQREQQRQAKTLRASA